MGIWKAWLGDLEIGWRSPVKGPVHPQHVNLAEPSGLGWLDGFDELLVRCGLESNGAPEFDATGRLVYPLHGRIANRPAHRVEVSIDDETGEITLVGEVDESRFHFQKLRLTSTLKTRPGEAGVRIVDTITNLSASPAEAQLLYHINIGQPLLEAGSQVVAPIKKLVPRNPHSAEGLAAWDTYPAPMAGVAEQVYFMSLAAGNDGRTHVLLKNGDGSRAVSLRYLPEQLPCFSLWKNPTASADGYVTGIEPATNFPNPRSFEKQAGRVVALAPGESVRFELALEVHADTKSVQAAEADVVKLNAGGRPKVYPQPTPDWTS
jgi:galactose mutarotase-like enzyme